MLILGLLGMYFDAAVVFFTNSSLLFRMAMAILCTVSCIHCLKIRASEIRASGIRASQGPPVHT